MKNRFDNEDYEEFGNFEDMDEEAAYISEEEYEKLISQANELQEEQLNLIHLDLNQRLLVDTISMLSKSWIWKFKGIKSRLRDISIAYKFFERLTDPKNNIEKK